MEAVKVLITVWGIMTSLSISFQKLSALDIHESVLVCVKVCVLVQPSVCNAGILLLW